MISLRLCIALFGVGFVGGFIYELKRTPARTNPPAIEHQDKGTLVLMRSSQQAEKRANCE